MNRSTIITTLALLLFASCQNAKPDPCACVKSFLAQDQKALARCEAHYETLSESEKEQWVAAVYACEGDAGSESQGEASAESLPAHIQQKIVQANSLSEQADQIQDASDMFSREALEVNKRKLGLLEQMMGLIRDIESSGYADQIDNFSGFSSGVKLKYTGVKMQIEALEEMIANGSI